MEKVTGDSENTHLIVDPEEETENSTEVISEEIIAKNFLKLKKDIKFQIQENINLK